MVDGMEKPGTGNIIIGFQMLLISVMGAVLVSSSVVRV